MKIYLVMFDDFETKHVLKAYTSRRAADMAASLLNEEYNSIMHWVEETDLEN